MALIDDLVSSGMSLPQAQAVIDEDTIGDNTDGLVAAGFSTTQAQAIHAYDANKTAANLDVIVQQGIWATTALPAVKAELDVTP